MTDRATQKLSERLKHLLIQVAEKRFIQLQKTIIEKVETRADLVSTLGISGIELLESEVLDEFLTELDAQGEPSARGIELDELLGWLVVFRDER